MGNRIKAAWNALRGLPADSVLAVSGVATMGVGLWMLSPAWSLIVVGGVFYLDGWIGRRK